MHVRDPGGDRQTEAGATPFVRPLTEAVEEALGPLGGEPGALVGDGERPLVAVGACGHRHGAAGRAVPDRVVEEVGGDLGEAGPVAGDGEVGGLDVGDDGDVPAVEGGLARGGVEELGDVDGGRREGDAAVGAGEVEQVGDERAEAFGLGEGVAEGGVGGCGDAVDEVFEQGTLGAERGAQLVGDGRDEPAAAFLALLEVVGHRREGPRQRADLVAAARGDRGAVVTAGHPLGRLGHLAKGGRHPGREPAGDDEGDADRRRQPEPQRDAGVGADRPDDRGDEDARADEDRQAGADRGQADERLGAAHRSAPSSRA